MPDERVTDPVNLPSELQHRRLDDAVVTTVDAIAAQVAGARSADPNWNSAARV